MKANMQGTPLARQHFEFLSYAHKVALDLVPLLSFEKKHPWHLHLVTLYGSMLELTGSACILIRNDVGIGVPIMLRSLVEADLDFVNLLGDRCYGYHMRASELKEWIKVLKEAKTGNNPFLTGVADAPGVGDMLAECEKEISDLRLKHYTPLQPQQKFSKANLGAVYRSVYNFLCCQSHNNIRALMERHATIAAGQKDFTVEFYRSIDLDQLLPYVDTFCGILVSATEHIHRLLQSSGLEAAKRLTAALAHQRELLMKEQD